MGFDDIRAVLGSLDDIGTVLGGMGQRVAGKGIVGHRERAVRGEGGDGCLSLVLQPLVFCGCQDETAKDFPFRIEVGRGGAGRLRVLAHEVIIG